MKTHLQQKVDGLCAGLSLRGIGAAYHYRTLREHAPELFESVDTIATNARSGRGLIFVGGAKAYDEAVLVARACYMKGIAPVVVPLLMLAQWLVQDKEDIDLAVDAAAVFVTGFVSNGDSPLTGRERTMVEEFILDRIDNGRAFFAQADCTIVGSRWWSPTLIERVLQAATVRVANESGAVATASAH